MTTSYQENEYQKPIIQPKKFVLWGAIASMIMMFAGLTSAYIVRKAQGNWVLFKMPDIFWISTIVIIISSITLYLAERSFKQENIKMYRLSLGITFVLAVVFLVCQYLGWKQMGEYGIHLKGNPSGSFLYVISGLHALHLVGGLFFILIMFVKSFFLHPVKLLIDTLNPERYLNIELLSTYWHFVDILWIYLFIFFLINSL